MSFSRSYDVFGAACNTLTIKAMSVSHVLSTKNFSALRINAHTEKLFYHILMTFDRWIFHFYFNYIKFFMSDVIVSVKNKNNRHVSIIYIYQMSCCCWYLFNIMPCGQSLLFHGHMNRICMYGFSTQYKSYIYMRHIDIILIVICRNIHKHFHVWVYRTKFVAKIYYVCLTLCGRYLYVVYERRKGIMFLMILKKTHKKIKFEGKNYIFKRKIACNDMNSFEFTGSECVREDFLNECKFLF